MSTPPFLESPRFPDNIAFGATVGPTYQTIVTPITSGRDGRIVQWTQARIRFEVGMRSMLASVTAQLDAYFRSVKGRAYGFRIKDWTDFNDGGNGVFLPTSTLGVYQMGKVYASGGALEETRLIQKPVVGTVVSTLNGSVLGSGYSLDTTTGLFTWSNPYHSAGVSSVTVGATTQVALASALPGLAVGGLLSLINLGGAGASLLNGQSFTVSAISGSTYTLAVNTAGATITAAGGVGETWLQPTDVFTWTGQFDVPVRFDVDEMKKQVMDRNGAGGDLIVDWGSIPLIEVRV
jgi:uncharacterized protein (TIGR02217 family)